MSFHVFADRGQKMIQNSWEFMSCVNSTFHVICICTDSSHSGKINKVSLNIQGCTYDPIISYLFLTTTFRYKTLDVLYSLQ